MGSEECWQVSPTAVIAWSCWLSGFVVITASCAGILEHTFAILGSVIIMFGCMAMVRFWIRTCAAREHDAFALGRASMQVVRD